MTLRQIALPALLALLAGCASEQPVPAPVEPVRSIPLPETKPFLHELQGTLLGVPANADVELALLQVDAQGRPQRLLSSLKLRGSGEPLPFRLGFNPTAFPADQKVELRGRASQSGRLILHLPSRLVQQADSQALGELHFVPAP
ncbi:MAG: YbaY family lipoprotein [Pseudomonas sp.]|uniref:YbaY family lipoprotein n=1 Tax=Pseudomonas sp. TaxID=306 RepID=UPI003D0D2470